jgi:hypothetical protein
MAYHRYLSGFAVSVFLIKTSAPTSGTIAHLDVSADVEKTILAQQLLTARIENQLKLSAFRLSIGSRCHTIWSSALQRSERVKSG